MPTCDDKIPCGHPLAPSEALCPTPRHGTTLYFLVREMQGKETWNEPFWDSLWKPQMVPLGVSPSLSPCTSRTKRHSKVLAPSPKKHEVAVGQKWVAPVSGNMDQNLRSPGGSILTHTQACFHSSGNATRTPARWRIHRGLVFRVSGKSEKPPGDEFPLRDPYIICIVSPSNVPTQHSRGSIQIHSFIHDRIHLKHHLGKAPSTNSDHNWKHHLEHCKRKTIPSPHPSKKKERTRLNQFPPSPPNSPRHPTHPPPSRPPPAPRLAGQAGHPGLRLRHRLPAVHRGLRCEFRRANSAAAQSHAGVATSGNRTAVQKTPVSVAKSAKPCQNLF